MRTESRIVFIEISVAVAGSEVMVHRVRYNCHAWDDGDRNPQTNDSGIYCTPDPTQVHPHWVTTEMLYHCDAAAEVEFIHQLTRKTEAA